MPNIIQRSRDSHHNFLCLTIAWQRADIATRERVALTRSDVVKFGAFIVARAGVDGCIVISTCNRFEVYVSRSGPDIKVEVCEATIAEFFGIDRTFFSEIAHLHVGTEAVLMHAARLASGLESRIVGEKEILGQWRRAARDAKQYGFVSPALSRLSSEVISVARTVRKRVGFQINPPNISAMSKRLARLVFGHEPLNITVLGTGEVATSLLRYWSRHSPKSLSVISHAPERANALGRRYSAQPYSIRDLTTALEHADLLLCASEANRRLITHSALDEATSRRKRPMLVVDYAVPRNVEPSCASLTSVYLRDLESIAKMVDQEMAHWHEKVALAESFLDDLVHMDVVSDGIEDISAAHQWLERVSESYKEAAMRIARSELRSGISPDAALERLAEQLRRSMLHLPRVWLNHGSVWLPDQLRVDVPSAKRQREDKAELTSAEGRHGS